MFKNFLLITFILWNGAFCLKNESTRKMLVNGQQRSECNMQKDEDLKELYWGVYKQNIDELNNGIEYSPLIQAKYSNYIIDDLDTLKSKDFQSADCCSSISSKNSPLQPVNSCPTTTKLVHRTDRIPFTRSFTSCACDSCFDSIGSFKCMPIKIAKLVLRRGACKSDGFYEWLPALEMVPIDCKIVEFGNIY
jgi:hypothetical protein